MDALWWVCTVFSVCSSGGHAGAGVEWGQGDRGRFGRETRKRFMFCFMYTVQCSVRFIANRIVPALTATSHIPREHTRHARRDTRPTTRDAQQTGLRQAPAHRTGSILPPYGTVLHENHTLTKQDLVVSTSLALLALLPHLARRLVLIIPPPTHTCRGAPRTRPLSPRRWQGSRHPGRRS